VSGLKVRWLAAAVVLLTGAAVRGDVLDQDPAARDAGSADVFVIGMIHAPAAFLLEPSYSPAHVRATLERFQPTAIGVEASPLWSARGISLAATWEIDHLVAPWAAARGIAVHGIDWVAEEDLASRARRRLASAREALARPARSLAERRRQADALAATIASQLTDDFADPDRRHAGEWFRWINSGARSAAPAVREFWEENGRNDPAGPEAGARAVAALRERHERVVELVAALARRQAGGRIAVLIGYSHKPDLDRRLALVPGLRVVQLGDLPPLAATDLSAAWRPEDAFATLREALDGDAYYFTPDAVDQKTVDRALDMLRRHGVQNDAVRYYEARLLAVQGSSRETERRLRDVLNSTVEDLADAPVPAGGPLSIRQRARLELGRALDAQGDRMGALREYERVRSELVAVAPPDPADDGFSTVVDWATAGFAASQGLATHAAVLERVETLLREPWSPPRR
jgi:hypothetical protein